MTVHLQGKIHKKVIETTDVQDRGMKAANFAVLRETKMPALLTENLFIDHEEDAQKLSDSDFLKDLARGHAQGLAAAFDLEQARSESDSDKNNSDADEADQSNDNSSAGSNDSDENNGSEEHEPQDPTDTPKKGSLLKRLFDWIRSKLF